MKKLTALMLSSAMMLSLAACGGSASTETVSSDAASSEAASSEAVSTEEAASADAAALTTVNAGKLTMSTNAAFPPYEMTTDTGDFEGIDIEVAGAIAKKLGLELQVDDMDFDAALLAAQNGKSDMVMAGVTVTDERLKVMDFSDTYAEGIQSIIVPEGSDIATVDDLSGKAIGTQRGTTGYLYCTDDFGEENVIAYDNGLTAVQALNNGQVDAVVIDNAPAKEFVAANPGLTKLLEDSIGPGFKQDASELKKFEKFADDSAMLDKLAAVKRANKVNFANYLEKTTGQVIDPDSIFDCQVKRMHEYKRQHLNAMNIAAEYLYLKANPNADFVPKTYIFGAKAAPGYYMAKQMIRMICKLGKLIDNDPAVKDKLRIVYLEDYCVSLSERLMPASEVSEQISLAGTEASGTGNMKFMLNGAITLGTLDGANVEIADAAGKDNEIIFGMLTPEVNALKGMGYHPQAFISDDNVAMAVLDMLEKGWNGENFSEITNNLRNSDPYMVLADFKDYRRAQHTVQELYKQKQTWNRMSLMNISNAGIFSADRSIMDYSRDIWGATPVK